MPAPIPEHTKQAILADIRDGNLSCRAIATKHRVSAATVSKIAKDAGITNAFERAQTARAHAARMVDQRELRSRRLESLGRLADDMIDRSFRSYAVIANGPDGPETVLLPKPPLRETEAAGRTMRAWLDAQVMIERHEAGTLETETAKSTLASILTLAREVADASRPDESSPPVRTGALAVDR
jgi:hypothetical protein